MVRQLEADVAPACSGGTSYDHGYPPMAESVWRETSVNAIRPAQQKLITMASATLAKVLNCRIADSFLTNG